MSVLSFFTWCENSSVGEAIRDSRWLFPAIQPNAARNVTASVGILFEPQKIFRPSQGDTGDVPRVKER